jgi:ubiquinone/menaquinone biosynthesis C-methylase UbiE
MSSRRRQRYIHGSKPREQRRLSLMNRLLNEACLRELALSGGEAVLDVGSGLGQFTRDMAREAGPDGRVVGIEGDAKQLAAARRLAAAEGEADRVEWRRGDVLSLPLRKAEWGRFDVAHARFVLEHVGEPERVVEQMVRAVRRGGRVVLSDDDHQVLRFWPEPPGLHDLWQTYIRAYDRLGCDPFIGRRLVALLHGAGARPIRNHWVFFGSCAGRPEFPALVENMIGVIASARAAITGPLAFPARQFDATVAATRAWARRPDAAVWYALAWAEGVRR